MSRTSTKKILIGLTSHGDLGGRGPTGYYLPEVAHPWQVFRAAGYAVTLASVSGGEPPADGIDLTDPVQQQFVDDPEMSRQLRSTPRFGEVDPHEYDALVFAGGHGTMWDFATDADLHELVRASYEAGSIVAAVCHGPAALVGVRLTNGAHLVEGLRVAAFTNDEEAAVGLAGVVPFLLQTELELQGAKHVAAPNFACNVVVDGRLITGQNPASATELAERVVDALREGAREH